MNNLHYELDGRPTETRTPVVAVVGGGYGGIAVAKALDDAVDVVLVEPRDTFVHNVAALRGLVDPTWTERLFMPYDRLLARGRVVRDRAVWVDAGLVQLGSGTRLRADYIVLATGSAYPFPAKVDAVDSAIAKNAFRRTREQLTAAESVLLLGAGAVGLELAGEIKAAWPDKAVTIVDPADDVLSGLYSTAFRTEIRRQLAALGVDLVLGTTLREPPRTPDGVRAPFVATTTTGHRIPADLWFRCYGVTPVTDYLAPALAAARRVDGQLDVTEHLRLAGQDTVFAIGDLTAVAEQKKAKAAEGHAAVVAANVRALTGAPAARRASTKLLAYQPSDPSIVLPLGPTGGASYTPELGVLDAETTVRLKSADLRLGTYAAALGVADRFVDRLLSGER